MAEHQDWFWLSFKNAMNVAIVMSLIMLCCFNRMRHWREMVVVLQSDQETEALLKRSNKPI